MLEIYPTTASVTTSKGRYTSRRNVGKKKATESYADFKARLTAKFADEHVVEYIEVEKGHFMPDYELKPPTQREPLKDGESPF